MIWGENPLFSETFFFFFRCSIGLSRNWDDGHQLCGTGGWGAWSERCGIRSRKFQRRKTWLEKIQGWKKGDNKTYMFIYIYIYIVYIYIYSMFIYVWWYNDIWYDIEFVFGVSNLLISKKVFPSAPSTLTITTYDGRVANHPRHGWICHLTSLNKTSKEENWLSRMMWYPEIRFL